jgi:hypothetical protein
MTVTHIVIFVEEPSMEAALNQLLPKLIGNLTYQIITFSCKSDLLKQLPARLRGYRWIPNDWRILVLVDRDRDDCHELKRKLEREARDAGFSTRSFPGKENVWQVVNRVVIEELEAWYFGDWQAVMSAYPKVPATIPAKEGYRNPDEIQGGTWEAFERILKRAGYFAEGLQKIAAAQAIAARIDPDRCTSPSFMAVRDVLREITAGRRSARS